MPSETPAGRPRPGQSSSAPAIAPDLHRRRAGTVSAFDEPAGLGEVSDADGAVWPFHCTAIADGSRSIAVGAAVDFALRHGRLGVTEAADLRPRPTPPTDGVSPSSAP